MKAFFGIGIYVILLLTSCGGQDESAFAIKQKLVSTNSAEIQFSNGKSLKIDSDQAEMRILKNAIAEKDSEETDCATDGKIIFYMQNMPVETIEFAIKPGCNYIYFHHQDKPYKKNLSAEALNYLQKLEKDN